MKTPKFTYDELSFLQSLPTKIIVAIVNGDIDVEYLASKELENRYLDKTGKWIGAAAGNTSAPYKRR